MVWPLIVAPHNLYTINPICEMIIAQLFNPEEVMTTNMFEKQYYFETEF